MYIRFLHLIDSLKIENNFFELFSVHSETDEQARMRFQVELEFIQCLANPNYLHCKHTRKMDGVDLFILKYFCFPSQTVIAQRGYFKDQTFINYLKYLTYWKEPEYARYIKYPMCLYFLDLLQYEHFRREIVNSQCVKFIDDQAILLWQHYTRRRMKLLAAAQVNQLSNGQNLSNGHQQQNGNSTPTQSVANGGGEPSGGGTSQRQT